MKKHLFAIFLLAAACGDSGTDPDGPTDGDGTGKGDQPVADGEFVPTYNNNLELNKGYHALFDASSNTCVEQLKDPASVQVVDVQDRFDLNYVTSRAELASQLNMDLTLKVGHTIGSANVGTKLVNDFAENSNSIHLLLTIERSYLVRNGKEVDYSERAIAKLESGTNDFLQACGANYVNSIRYGGYAKMLIVFQASDSALKRQVEAEIGAESKVLDLSGTLNTMISHSTSNEDASLSVTAIRSGLDSESANLADLIAAGVSPETLTQLKNLEVSLGRSVRNDFCADSGQCLNADGLDCEPCDSAPGYFDNPTRKSAVVGVHLGAYNKLFSSSSSFKPTYDEIREQWRVVELTTRDLSLLGEQMDEIYYTQLRMIMNAAPEEQVFFQIDGETSLETTDELVERAAAWEAKFHPERGTEVIAIKDFLDKCWGEAAGDIAKNCDGAEVAGLMETAAGAIADYQREGEIKEIAVGIPGALETEQTDAAEVCSSRLSPRGAWRLAKAEEAPLLRPLMHAGIQWPVGQEQELMIDDNRCSGRDVPVYHNGSGEWEVSCLERERRSVVCVPSAGPFSTTLNSIN